MKVFKDIRKCLNIKNYRLAFINNTIEDAVDTNYDFTDDLKNSFEQQFAVYYPEYKNKTYCEIVKNI